jgi:release factor glutamine methyltransferase
MKNEKLVTGSEEQARIQNPESRIQNLKLRTPNPESRILNRGSTLSAVLSQAEAELTAHGIENPRLDAEVLLVHVLKTDRAGLYTHLYDPLVEEQIRAFDQLVQRRAQREPLQYITGVQEFWSLAFKVDPRVLIPRPETEVVVEVALPLLRRDTSPLSSPSPFQGKDQGEREFPLKLLDIGTGSGCIAIALAAELPQAAIWAIDISADALAIARKNAQRHGVAERILFLQGDLFVPFREDKKSFDLIVSNPPYIERDDLPSLQPEVQDWEPRVALDGGTDGLDFYRRLLAEGPAFLCSGGWLVMEIGHGQADEVLSLVREQRDLTEVHCVYDYAGKERAIMARKA